MNKKQIYIYLDNKILGAAHQLVEYFDSNVFDREETIVYFKEYKKTHNKFLKIFKIGNIQAKSFKKYSEIQMQEGGIVFYLFNAQSNCRIVADRRLKHIFVTHGESNKISSIKPIIRIYDFVITAGEMGINRYLNSGIFYQADIDRGRVIMMGDTFIGKNNYHYSESVSSILYAPTWEGGVATENYSSLEWGNIFQKICTYMKNSRIENLVIQPHPNLGHREPKYIKTFYNGIKFLLKQGISIVLVKVKPSFLDKFYQKKYKDIFKIQSKQDNIFIKEAFCDVSAMEAQIYSKKIPVRIFIQKKDLNFQDTILDSYYNKTAISENEIIKTPSSKIDDAFYHYILGYSSNELKDKTDFERVNWLIQYVYDNKLVKNNI